MPVTLNEIEARLRRLYTAVQGTKPTGLKESEIKVQRLVTADGVVRGMTMDWEFERSEDELYNLALNAINSLAVFYNYCKPYALSLGVLETEIEDLTKNCLALRIARDLHNTEKHPEMVANRSGLSPRLQKVTHGMKLGTPDSKIEFDFVTGKMKVIGTALVTIHAEIINTKTGVPVAKLEELLAEGITAWESFLSTHKII